MSIDPEDLAKIEANKRAWQKAVEDAENSLISKADGHLLKKYVETSERQRSFDALRRGITEKFVANELDLENRQLESVLKLVETDEDNYSLSHGYFHACTAFGKTYLMMAMAEGYRDKEPDKKIIVLEENAKVLEQVKQDFMDKTSFAAEDIGAFYGKEKSVSAPVIVATYASMEKMVKAVGKENIGLVLCDEAHHILSENRQRVAKIFDRSCLYGFTATPEYDEDRGCAQVFGEIIDSVTLREGVEQGLLCSFKNGLFVSNIPVDLSGALNNSGDYDGEKLAEILKQSHLNGIREELANFYLSGEDPDIGTLRGKKMIVNAPNQHEADELAKVFNQTAGYNVARAYHTNTGEQPLAEFNQGRFPVLIQVNRVTEGYSNNKVEICINYPTASKVRSAQRGGRALRRDKENPDKLALIMDIAFKRNNEKSDLEEIRANGQVLFQDIAGDVEMLSPVRLAKIADERESSRKRQQTEKDEKEALAPDRLFKTVVNVKELYDMRITLLENDEKNTPSRAKRTSDLDMYTFQQRWSCRKNGKTLAQENKNDLFKQLQQQQPELFTYVQAGSTQSHVIARENIPAFKQALAEMAHGVRLFVDDVKPVVGAGIDFVVHGGGKAGEGVCEVLHPHFLQQVALPVPFPQPSVLQAHDEVVALLADRVGFQPQQRLSPAVPRDLLELPFFRVIFKDARVPGYGIDFPVVTDAQVVRGDVPGKCVGVENVPVIAEQSLARGADPQVAFLVFADGGHPCVDHFALGGPGIEEFELVLHGVVAEQAFVRAHPQLAFVVLEERRDILVAVSPFPVGTVDPHHVLPVVAVQPVFRAEPHEAVAVLDDGFHVAFRESGLAVDMDKGVVPCLLRISREDTVRAHQQKYEKKSFHDMILRISAKLIKIGRSGEGFQLFFELFLFGKIPPVTLASKNARTASFFPDVLFLAE